MKNYAKVVILKLGAKSVQVKFDIRIFLLLLGSLPVLLFGQLSAEIEVEQKDVCIPQPVKLKIKGCTGCVSFEWKIGNGKYQSGADKYATIITTPGVYDVSVIVTTASNQKFGIYKQQAFTVRSAPTVNLGYDKQSVCGANDTFTFIDKTPNSISRDWLMEGQMMYNGPDTLKHVFSSLQGYKRVFIVVRDSWGCAASKLFDSFFSVWSLKPRVWSDPSTAGGCLPANIKFTSNYQLNGQSIDTISWKFPGSLTPSATGLTANARYNKMDTFSFGVFMKTKEGCRDSVWYRKAILTGDSVKLGLTIPSNALCIRQKTQITVNGVRNKASWSFPNNSSGVNIFRDSSNEIGIYFTDTGWKSIRAYEVNHGCLSEGIVNRAIYVRGPRAGFVSEIPNYCGLPDSVKLTNTSLEGPGMTWQWRLTDSNNAVVTTGTGKNFLYIANQYNRFSARLIASSTNGCRDTLELRDVSIGGRVDADFTIGPIPTCPNTEVGFALTKPPVRKGIRYYYSWAKYDKTGNISFTNDQESPVFYYSANGRYHARLIFSTSRGCKDTVFKPDSVLIKSPEPELFVSDTIVCAREAFTVNARLKEKFPGFYGYWEAQHLDSNNVRFQVYGDSVNMSMWMPGPYQLSYFIQRIKDNSCRQGFTFKNKIKVSGAIVKASSTPTFGCSPLSISLKANVTADYNYQTSPGPVKFLWKRTPRQNFTLTDTTSSTVSTTLPAGEYYAWVIYTNNAGCTDSSGRITIQSGLKSQIEVPWMGRCRGVPVQLINRSSPWADSIRYVCDSPNIRFSPSAVHFYPSFVSTKGGNYKVYLIAKYKNCVDTSSAIINVVQAKASFYSADTITYCAPKVAEIFNTSPNAMRTIWYFSDRDTIQTLHSDKLVKLFVRNNPDPGYSVKLILTDYNGCRDTLEKFNHFRVIGPVPEVKISNNIGCEPLEVRFINNSKYFNKFYLDYGDGAVLDSINGKIHKYRVTDKALTTQVFKPKMLVADTLGCVVLTYPDDSVQVYKSAEARFSFTSANFLRKTEGCAGDLLVRFTDLSRFSVRNFWDFDGNDTIDITGQPNPSYLFTRPGRFYPRLISQNINGCRDTVTIDSIIVWEKPQPAFTSRDTTCARDMVYFTYSGKSRYALTKYIWDFDETWTVKDTSSQKNTKWKYTAPFNHLVSLNVTDVNGCKAIFYRNVFVLDTAGPVKPSIAYVTVRNNQFADMSWNKSGLGNYYRYHIYQDSTGYYYKYGVLNRADTFRSHFKGFEMNNKRFCYAMRIEDTCSQMGKMSTSHCTIVLRDSAMQLYHMHLNWLSYDGWGPDLSHYEVFRRDQPGGNFKRIAMVDKDNLIYTDSFLCDQTYCWYVEAVHKNREYRSRSNETCGRPIYRKPEGLTDIELVTVVNDSFPRVKWNSTYMRIPGSVFVIEKSVTGAPGAFQYTGETKAKSFDDRSSDPHSSAWYYRITFKDHCGTLGNPGSVSNSIYLRPVPGGGGPGKVKIAWNDYKYWHSGVKEYRAEVKNSSGVFVPWLTFMPGDLEKENIDLESFQVDTITFRIIAIKDSADQLESYSNTVSFIPSSYLWVPSGFTPDDNGLNEIFRPSVGYVFGDVKDASQRYQFTILNRWGQVVFKTNNPKQGWDGTLNGQPCQVGLYIYQVSAVGYDGVSHRKNGTIYLSR